MPRCLKKGACVCSKCKVGFKSKFALENHICALSNEPALEVEVEAALDRPINVITEREDENAFQCVLCFKTYKTLKGCNVHMNYCRNADSKASPVKRPKPSPVKRPKPSPVKRLKPSPARKRQRKVKELSPSDDAKANISPAKKKDRRYVCSDCPQVCTSLNEYRKHMKSHIEVLYEVDNSINSALMPITITSSETSTIVVPSTITQIKQTTSATKDLMHECPNCSQRFQKIGSYRRHLRSHLNIHSYKCKHCLVSYLSKLELVAHVKQLHGGEKGYTCTLCNKKFHHSIGFRKHKSEHLSSPPYQCFKCDAIFPSIAKQLLHISNHAVSCTFCRKPFAHEEELLLHATAEHAEDMEDADFLSETSDCEESDSNDELNANFNEVDVESDADSYTSIESDSEESSPKKNLCSSGRNNRRPIAYVCFICERRFAKQRSLELHMKSHKIHSCVACPKFFSNSAELQVHQQEHLKNNSSFYSKAFNDLQLTLNQQPTSIVTVLPVSAPTNYICSTSSETIPQITKTDILSWYAGYKAKTRKLSYPISTELCKDINFVIGELAPALYAPDKDSPEKREFIRIYYELTRLISKNAKHLIKKV